MDKIFIHALKTETIIGIYDWERQVRQTVIIDIEISADIRKAALTDSIEDTLNYKRVAKRVLAFVEDSQFHLVETLAEHIAMLILEEFGVGWVRITLSKPGAVRSSRDVGVALERDRAHLERWRAAALLESMRAGPCRRIVLDRPLSWRQIGADRRGRRPRALAGRCAGRITAAHELVLSIVAQESARIRRQHRRRGALRRHRAPLPSSASCRATSS